MTIRKAIEDQAEEDRCQATDRFGNRCIRSEHANDKTWPGHSFPKTAEQARVEQDDALTDFTRFLGIGE